MEISVVRRQCVKLQCHEKWIHEGRKEQQRPELKNSSKYICEVFGLILSTVPYWRTMHQCTEEQRNSLNVKSVEWCERAGGCCSNIRFPLRKHQECGGTVCHTISKTSQYLANPCNKQSWYWKMFLPIFDVKIVTNSYCYIVSGNY